MKSRKKPLLSIIVPAYNAGRHIPGALSQIRKVMKNSGYEIIVSEDGSSDNTAQLVREQMKKSDRIRLLSSEKRKGRGQALDDAIRISRGEMLLYMDADLSTNVSEIRRVLDEMRSADIVVGSRLLPASHATRYLMRGIFSRAYNLLVRLLFASKIHDHQCGFKAFKKGSILPILPLIKDRHWFWDTEMLVLAQKRGLVVREIPVVWKESGSSTVNLLPDSIYMLREILRLYSALKRASG